MHRKIIVVLFSVIVLLGLHPRLGAQGQPDTTAAPTLPAFPIGVWLQVPKNAPAYKAAGINVYVGLWKGPTEKQLAELGRHKMPVICAQNAVGIANLKNPIIAGWMQPDEPDNAKSIVSGWSELAKARVRVQIDGSSYGRYGPPVPPARIVDDYKRMKAVDPTRPVFLNLGQGVVWRFPGRGVRTGHDEDYPKYIEGCDIVSFDIYPAGSTRPEIRDKLHLVGQGVTRLRKWAGDKKPTWAIIAANRAGIEGERPTPSEVRSQAWMAIIHGARGLVYFVHHFKPFVEAGLLRDKEMLEQVGQLNRQITDLAPVILSPDLSKHLRVETDPPTVPVEAILRRHDGATWLFAVGTRAKEVEVRFSIEGLDDKTVARSLVDDRRIDVIDGRFTDTLPPYGVGLYRIGPDR